MMFLGLAFVIISAVMIYLVKVGVSLRPALYIKPSLMTDGVNTVARDVSLRLFPDLQGAGYLVWGIASTDGESQRILNLLKTEEEHARGKSISVLAASDQTSSEELAQCATPCWILREHDQAHELTANAFIREKLRPLSEKIGTKYFTLTIVPFRFGVPVPEECWAEKRLDFKCIQLVSVQAAERKLPKNRVPPRAGPAGAELKANESSPRYFFMNKYNEGDYFLFIEQPVGS